MHSTVLLLHMHRDVHCSHILTAVHHTHAPLQQQVNSDINAVKSWGSSAGDAVAKNTPSINTPEVGGFFGTNPKQQADTINAKTAQKVCVLFVCIIFFLSYVIRHFMHAHIFILHSYSVVLSVQYVYSTAPCVPLAAQYS
jgi:hypothetical protein